MTHYRNIDESTFCGHPVVNLRDGERSAYPIAIATNLAKAIDEEECFILAEGSEVTTFYDHDAWLASWYVIRPSDTHVVVAYYTDKEVRALSDTVKIQCVAAIIAEMNRLGYDMQPLRGEDYSYHAYHYGCDLVFKKRT